MRQVVLLDDDLEFEVYDAKQLRPGGDASRRELGVLDYARAQAQRGVSVRWKEVPGNDMSSMMPSFAPKWTCPFPAVVPHLMHTHPDTYTHVIHTQTPDAHSPLIHTLTSGAPFEASRV